ncbi:phage distal tail protein [Romboutsia sp. 1001216sp1]|uniref:phage distal tail protein n=1 Tax=Romboutsia sp. 1001216sp1 TaxID=2986997 RepID=UPI00232F243C|nr:phage tail domain-containing protein [Romboutsia sp. 1001216sp1]MDB8805009.1 phage tail family protein [Romboutsia sp. 1001216sp1]MDB8807999.1 phage tail family protein [Romboutsia sp. 1001216sp1]MDB8810654.1 phage tail family protein [Romboutsia sp. 1001216sp1]MDB8816374.1 phage tail family protein [Romboutsia sp. 1001216sp1]MDB8818673.1 phage tail family protein [Romboutsia sp. 1001216sp1]
MINKIVYENERGISIELNRDGPLFLFSAKGFDGLEADVVSSKSAYQDGVSISKTILKSRVLTLNCYLEVDNEQQRDILKRKLYNAFNPKLKGYMKIYTDANKLRGASNLRVIQAPIFDDDYESLNELVGFQIQLSMPLPYFEDINENRVDFGNDIGNFFFDLEIEEEGKELSIKNNSIVTNIANMGDAETPIKVVFKAKSELKNPSIYNVYNKEYIKINRTMQEGEEIIVTTHKGNKRVESYLNGITSNIFNDLDLGSSFIWLDVGDNVIRYDAETMIEQLEVYIYYTNYYLGV